MTVVRQPIVAGQFYASSPRECAEELKKCIPQQSEFPVGSPVGSGELLGGIVPHAGWNCSGKVTGRVLRALAERACPAERASPHTVVLIGAVHTVKGPLAAIFDRGIWETPLGQALVNEKLADELADASDLIERNQRAHLQEHSLEVQIPFVQNLFPDAQILPVMVPPSALAPKIGRLIGRKITEQHLPMIVVGTSDLTHYGPSYGMTSHGLGQEGLDWAKKENDRRMIDKILALSAEEIVPEAAERRNACGGGAIAATIAACQEMGACKAVLLEHTTSQETLAGVLPGLGSVTPPSDAVGYAGIVFCK